MEEEVRDIKNEKGKYFNWKKEVSEFGIDGISKKSSELIVKYVLDMEEGKNVAKGSRKGGRGIKRLNTLRTRLVFITKILEKRGLKSLDKADVNIITSLSNDMQTGRLKKSNGQKYRGSIYYVKDFKAFWHWHIKVNKKEKIEIEDITEELDTAKDEENEFVFFTKEDLEKMMPYFSQDEQVRLLFMFDTIIRSPGELTNLKVYDISEDYKELNIRKEISKTYGRRIKLLLCTEELKKYVERNKLKPNDYLFTFSSEVFNDKLQKIAKQLFEDRISKGGQKYSDLTMYDFRHSGACHWRTGAYRSKIDALMYRGGWNTLTRLNYYTKTIGMKDSIEKDDLLIGIDKHEMEKRMEELQKQLDEQKNRQERTDKINEEISKRISELSPKQIKEFMYFKKKS